MTSRRRILLVEDDETLALLITYNLQAKGYSVSWLARGDAVEPFLASADVDLIVLDWMLPGRSGLDLCRSLRGRPDMRSLPIIMVTALEDDGDRVAGLSAGADAYFAKPFLMTELLARVDSLLSPPLGAPA
ncbi:MAG: response regulator transcription factor [Beijerinckiaceae bacterium]